MCLASASDTPAVRGWSHGGCTDRHALASQFWAFKQHWYRKDCSFVCTCSGGAAGLPVLNAIVQPADAAADHNADPGSSRTRSWLVQLWRMPCANSTNATAEQP